MKLLDPPSLYKFLLLKTEPGLILLCYFYNLTAQLFAAWQSQVSALLLPDLPLSIWVQDKQHTTVVLCDLATSLLSPSLNLLSWTNSCLSRGFSTKKHWLYCTSLPSCFQQQHSQKENYFPSVTWTWINVHSWPGCSISGSVSAPPGLRAIWTLNHETWLLFPSGFVC